MNMIVVDSRARAAWLLATLAAALLLASATPAWAHVPFLEPAGVASSTRGPAADPFPDAVTVGSPEVSRAIYGYLGPKEFADVYRFRVSRPTTVPIGILVPEGPDAARFRPELSLYGTDPPVGMYDRSGAERPTFFEPFEQMTLYRGPQEDVGLAPGRDYYVIVTGGKGEVRAGRYVVSMGTVEGFTAEDAVRTPAELARIKAGDYGGAPADWSWAIWVAVALVVVVVAAVAAVVWLRRSRARG